MGMHWRFRRGLACACTAAAVAAAAALVSLLPARRTAVPSPEVAGAATQQLRDVHTTVVTHNGRRGTVSAREILVVPAPLLGPIRLGFLRSIEARQIEMRWNAALPAMPAGEPAPADSPFSALTDVLVNVPRPLLARSPAAQSSTALRAERCLIGSAAARVVCSNGVIDVAGRELAFDEASYDGGGWHITPASDAGRGAPPAADCRESGVGAAERGRH
jgi:hypothetical protein